MKKILLFFNTIKYLKFQQVYFRVLRAFLKPKVTDEIKHLKISRPSKWNHITLHKEKIDINLNACFLNHTKKY